MTLAKIRFYIVTLQTMITSDVISKMSDSELAQLLTCDDDTFAPYARAAFDIVVGRLGGECYLRGLIETHNSCIKDCLYCGIRRSNTKALRYRLDDDTIVSAAQEAVEAGYGSIVLQGGEQCSDSFTSRIETLLHRIGRLTPEGGPAVTLSLGEQSLETYRRWRKAGAKRYLLRIESSNPDLYRAIHPDDGNHSHTKRIEALQSLREADFQVGTGVMIGLPGQSVADLVSDLRFMQETDIDMCGMGPYLEHGDTPLYERRGELMSQDDRLRLSLRMVSLLRLLMPDINIAATTALQAISPSGRQMALSMGANVIMPNITPPAVKADYKLYENKPLSEKPEYDPLTLMESIEETGLRVSLGTDGTSKHYLRRKSGVTQS